MKLLTVLCVIITVSCITANWIGYVNKAPPDFMNVLCITVIGLGYALYMIKQSF
jgi:hypothetical protein